MVQQVLTSFVCDLPHEGEEVETTEPAIYFAWGPANYAIEACTPHAQQIRETFAGFAGYARKIGSQGPRTPDDSRRTAKSRQATAAIRVNRAGEKLKGDSARCRVRHSCGTSSG
jgi:Lsr2